MVKTPSSVDGVYLVGPAGGKMRPWCGKCHKFLKSETAAHDCTPIDFSKVRAAKKANGGKSKKFRMTKKRDALLKKLIQAGGIVRSIENSLDKIEKASSPKALHKAVSGLKRSLNNKKGIAAKTSSLYKKFYK